MVTRCDGWPDTCICFDSRRYDGDRRYLHDRTFECAFAMAPTTMTVILWIGVATSVFAAVIGLKQNDIKKVLAYSTVSQLGLMFAALGLGAFSSGVFHLVTHAFSRRCYSSVQVV